MANDILKGIKVVELSTYIAAPMCGRELAELGADVIKVESPIADDFRKLGTLFQIPNEEGNKYLFSAFNINKKSVCLDFKKEGATEAMMELISKADVFINTNREEVMERLGLGLDMLHEKFPKLVICSVSGFGHKGPMKNNRGYDLSSFWSPAGMVQEWNFKGNRPFKPFYGFGDTVTAGQMTVGILAALYRRERTGLGDLVRVSLLGSGLWTNVTGLVRYQVGHVFPKSFYSPLQPVDNMYETKDGKFICLSEPDWDGRHQYYFELFGTPELNDDPEWNCLSGFMNDIPSKVHYFEDNFKRFTAQEIFDWFTPHGVVVSILGESTEVLTNPQAWSGSPFPKPGDW